MKINSIIIKIADLLLDSEHSSADWKKDKRLMTAWYIFFFLVLIILIYKGIEHLLVLQLSKSVGLTDIFRIGKLVLVSLSIFSLGFLTYRYYRFILDVENRIYFINIIYFYLISILIFSYVYSLLYTYNSAFFVTSIQLPVHSETYVNYGYERYITAFKFHLYSAMQSVTGNFKSISSNSIVVSIYNYLQNIYTISLLSLLVSSFVNRNKNVA